MKPQVIFWCTAVLYLTTSYCNAVPAYTIQPIGTYMEAWAVNDSGQVVVYPFDGHTYVWDQGQMNDVGRLGSAGVYTQNINNQGRVVSFYDGGSGERAFVGANGSIQDLGVNPGGASTAMCISNAGAIAGVRTINGVQQAFYMQNGVVRTIPGLSGPVWAYAINDAGAVVGDGRVSGKMVPYIYQNGTTTVLPVSMWGTAQGINNFNHVAGTLGISGGNHAYVYKNGSFTDLGAMIPNCTNSWGTGINDAGQVIVQAFGGPSGRSGYLFENNRLYNLTDLVAEQGWQILAVEDINAAGQMVGLGIYNDEYYAYLMTPIPEPATLGLLALGTLAVRKKTTGKR